MVDLELKLKANHIRQGIIRGIHAAQSGHPYRSLSATDVLTYSNFAHQKHSPKLEKYGFIAEKTDSLCTFLQFF